MGTTAPSVHTDRTPLRTGWIVPLISLTTYTALFVAGYFLNMPVLSQIGFLAFVYIFIVGNYEHMLRLKSDHTVTVAMIMTTYLALHFFIFLNTLNPQPFSKIVMIFILYILFFSYNHVPMPMCRERHAFIIITGIIIAGSLLVDREAISKEHTRLSGLFINPNNFALSVYMLLFFIDEDNDRKYRKLSIHAAVLVCLMLSATTGSILAYMVALSYKYRKDLLDVFRYRYAPHLLAAVCIAAIALMTFDLTASKASAFKRLWYQLAIVYDNIESTLEGRQINLYYFDSKYGMVVSSGIWRITYWLKVLKYHIDSGYIPMLIGHGAGSTRITLGMLPHNDYLRLFFEYGAAGMFIFIYFFISVFRRMMPPYRYIIIMFAFYCITENNLDNMLFMSMFIAFIATTQAEPASPQLDRRHPV